MQYQELNSLIVQADNAEMANNVTAAYQLFRQVEDVAVQLYMYVYTYQINLYWAVKPYMHGYMGTISWEENPMVVNKFYLWVKG
jgi:hypothetical protein